MSSHITAGESAPLFLEIYPENATANRLNEHIDLTLLTPDIATLEYSETDGWVLTASHDYSALSQHIKVEVSIPSENYSQIYEWSISSIPVESMAILNAETGTELESVTYLYRGDTLKLNAVYYPENASVGEITYHYGSQTTANCRAYVNISDDGFLTVSDNAPFNMEIDMNITAGRKSSKMYKIIILQRMVESYEISCDTDTVEIGKAYTISFSYTPSNAEITSRRYALVEEAQGIYVSANSFYVSPDATVGSTFQIICYCEGIESNILTFTVVEPQSSTE